jgi:hypothetical protein
VIEQGPKYERRGLIVGQDGVKEATAKVHMILRKRRGL